MAKEHSKKFPRRSVLNRALKEYRGYRDGSIFYKDSFFKCCQAALDNDHSSMVFYRSRDTVLYDHRRTVQHIARKYDIRQQDLRDLIFMKKLLDKIENRKR